MRVVVATVLVPFGLGYFLSYLFRTVNVVIAPDLARDLALGAADLGLLTSIYFVVFAAFQLPLGVLLDRYGPRRVQIWLLLIAAAGAILFAVGESFLVVAVARGLIGLGVSGALMAGIMANVLWFPRERLPLVNGIIGACGSIGALSATVPVELLMTVLGWRTIFLLLAAVTLATVAILVFAVPERRGSSPGGGVRAQLRDMGEIYGSGFFWRVCIMVFVHNASFLGYQTLWMGPWLRDVAGMDSAGAAHTLLWFNVGMAVGVLSIGALSERLQRVGVRPVTVIAVAVVASIVTQTMLALEFTALALPLCFAFGYFGSCGLLVYAVLGQSFPVRLVGRVNTAQNMMVFIGAFAAQWGIGAIINMWPPVSEGRYDPAAHQVAFFVMIGLQLAALGWFLIARYKPPGTVDKAAAAAR
jgi:predicted MFS family arabinose efflux permease